MYLSCFLAKGTLKDSFNWNNFILSICHEPDLVGADPLMRELGVYFWLPTAYDAKHMLLGV